MRERKANNPLSNAFSRSTRLRTGNVSRLLHGDFTKTIQDGTMTLVITVTKVETGNVHSSIHELCDVLLAPAGRSNGANNLGTTVLVVSGSLLDHIQGDETSCQNRDIGSIGNHIAMLLR